VIKILIVDDHPLVSDGIATMLRDQSSRQIVGASKTAAEALAFLANEEPDIILLSKNNWIDIYQRSGYYHRVTSARRQWLLAEKYGTH
jgi:DNA-binding NarL/FixJ family response regulator